MARQDPTPPMWHPMMSDGCTGVFDWLPFVGDMTEACAKHDRAYYYGGTKADKLKADKQLRADIIALDGWLAWLSARIRFWGVRKFANKNFNWLGPGLPENKT
jgi:hypothetical protein